MSTLATSTLAIECQNVRKGFGRGEATVAVLRGTDFTAHYGEMTFLVGPSGCGKTTLVSILGGLLTPDSGMVQVLGTHLGRLSNGALADFRCQNLGFIFQQFNLLPSLSALQNASVPLLARGVSTRQAERAAAELLVRMGMEKQLSKYPAQLSGGQQQRVAIARALVHRPRLILCDEPTASLDAESGHRVMELLRALTLEPNRAVVVVTHDDRIYRFADRVVTMADGLADSGVLPHSRS